MVKNMVIFYIIKIQYWEKLQKYSLYSLFLFTRIRYLSSRRAIYLSTQRSVEVLLLLVSVHIWRGSRFYSIAYTQNKGRYAPSSLFNFGLQIQFSAVQIKHESQKRIENIFAPKLSLKLNLFLLLFIPHNPNRNFKIFETCKRTKLLTRSSKSRFLHK